MDSRCTMCGMSEVMSDANLRLRLTAVICLLVAAGLSRLWQLRDVALCFGTWGTCLAIFTTMRLRWERKR